MTSSSAIADGKPHYVPIMACCFSQARKSWAAAIAAAGSFLLPTVWVILPSTLWKVAPLVTPPLQLPNAFPCRSLSVVASGLSPDVADGSTLYGFAVADEETLALPMHSHFASDSDFSHIGSIYPSRLRHCGSRFTIGLMIFRGFAIYISVDGLALWSSAVAEGNLLSSSDPNVSNVWF